MADIVFFSDAREKVLHKAIEDRLRRTGIFDLDAAHRRITLISALRDNNGIPWDDAAAIVDREAER